MVICAAWDGAAAWTFEALRVAGGVKRPGRWRHAPAAVLLVVHPEPNCALPAGLWLFCDDVWVVQECVLVAVYLFAEGGVVEVPGELERASAEILELRVLVALLTFRVVWAGLAVWAAILNCAGEAPCGGKRGFCSNYTEKSSKFLFVLVLVSCVAKSGEGFGCFVYLWYPCCCLILAYCWVYVLYEVFEASPRLRVDWDCGHPGYEVSLALDCEYEGG